VRKNFFLFWTVIEINRIANAEKVKNIDFEEKVVSNKVKIPKLTPKATRSILLSIVYLYFVGAAVRLCSKPT
jgi:hypothetical protein